MGKIGWLEHNRRRENLAHRSRYDARLNPLWRSIIRRPSGRATTLNMPKFLRKPEARLAPPPPTPRPVSAHEAEVIKRMLHLKATVPHINVLFASVDRLTVIEGCDCGCDSIFFDEPRKMGRPIVSGLGCTAGNNEVEVVLWARDTTLTFLEIEPWGNTLKPVRMPLAESIAPYPADAFGCDEDDEEENADA